MNTMKEIIKEFFTAFSLCMIFLIVRTIMVENADSISINTLFISNRPKPLEASTTPEVEPRMLFKLLQYSNALEMHLTESVNIISPDKL